MENKKWIVLCIIGGMLMIIGSTVGSTTFFATLFNAVSGIAPELAPIFNLILTIFNYIALGGGISVIVGAIIVAMDHYGIGKFIISLGAGMGLIGLIIYVITGIIGGSLTSELISLLISLFTLNGGFGFLGVILTIISRFKLKKQE